MRKGGLLFLLVALSVIFVSCEYALGVRLIPLSELNEEKSGMVVTPISTSGNKKYATLIIKYYEQSSDLKSVEEKEGKLYFNKRNYRFYTDEDLTMRLGGGDPNYVLLRALWKYSTLEYKTNFWFHPVFPDDAHFTNEDVNVDSGKKIDKRNEPVPRTIESRVCMWRDIYGGYRRKEYRYTLWCYDPSASYLNLSEWEGKNGHMNSRYVSKGYNNVELMPLFVVFGRSSLHEDFYPFELRPTNYELVGWEDREENRDLLGYDDTLYQYTPSFLTREVHLYAKWKEKQL